MKVKDLCDKAMINKTTFYSHYETMDLLHKQVCLDFISDMIKQYKPIEKRWETEKIKGLNIINDSYNANPDSMLAVIKTVLQNYEKPILFVLGNMGELGKDEVLYHQKVGIYLSDTISDGVSVITVGELAHEISDVLNNIGKTSLNFSTNDEAGRYILDNVLEGTTIVLKASHSMQFEKILDYLKKEERL